MEPAGFLLMYPSFAINFGTRWVPFNVFFLCYKHWIPLGSFQSILLLLYTLEPAGFLLMYPSFAINLGTRWVPFNVSIFCYKPWNPLGSF